MIASALNPQAPVRPQPGPVLDALAARRFFKLICGGSFTETRKIEQFVGIYAQAGADCIDIAPDLDVLDAVSRAYNTLPPEVAQPLVMVSLPLDPDPHFRKIELLEPDCTRCGACLPVCPTDAITLPDALEISQALCYGCGRCVPLCPTEALRLLPFQVREQIEPVLSHPLVGAVEIHSRHGDPLMLEAFLLQWQPLLRDKLIALCFNPEEIPTPQWLAFVQLAERYATGGLVLQIDGAPMSGTDHPHASLPAIRAAQQVQVAMQRAGLETPITISGGINAATAQYLSLPENAFIAGAGMGTVARRLIWEGVDDPKRRNTAVQAAKRMVALFKARGKSAIMETSEEGMNSGQTATETDRSN